MGPLEKLPKNWKEFLSVDENKDTDVNAVSSFNGRVERWEVLLRLLMLSEKLDKPPTKATLDQHVKRASLQSQGWIRVTHLNQKLPNPSDYRWTKDIRG